jgi:hypothetical protein
MRIRINLKAGKLTANHNQQARRDRSEASSLKVKSNVKAGGLSSNNHNQTVAGG